MHGVLGVFVTISDTQPARDQAFSPALFSIFTENLRQRGTSVPLVILGLV